MTGTVFNIQKFSIHDGPGIRTTVFLKGCPLSCSWCHNPEGIHPEKQIIWNKKSCIHCLKCIENCGKNAIQKIEDNIITDPKKCIKCGDCISVCPVNARSFTGNEMSSDELYEILKKDRVFYDESAGGVTFSGGEPLLQSEFVSEVSEKLRNDDISVAIDTSGYVPFEKFELVDPFSDIYLFDLKTMNEKDHIKYTGVSNKLIIENLRKLSGKGTRIIIRIPLVKGINDGYNNSRQTADLMNELNIKRIDLLPYHTFGKDKYYSISKIPVLFEAPEDNVLNELTKIYEERNIEVRIGG